MRIRLRLPLAQLRMRHIFERYLWVMAQGIATFIFILLGIKFFIVDSGKVEGRSMEPTFVDNNIFFINKLSYFFHPPERYDVVQIIDPQAKKLIIKRVIGLPGDIVIVKRGSVFVQRSLAEEPQQLNEMYLPPDTYTVVKGQRKPEQYLILQDHYFVLGDNRGHSTDSRVYGPIHRSTIVGKVLMGKAL